MSATVYTLAIYDAYYKTFFKEFFFIVFVYSVYSDCIVDRGISEQNY